MEGITGKFENGVFTATISGRVDSTNSAAVEAALKELLAGKEIKSLIFDAEKLEYI